MSTEKNTEKKENIFVRGKNLVVRNGKKVAIGIGIAVGTLIVGWGAHRLANADDDFTTVEEDYESVTYIEDSQDSEEAEDSNE